MKWLAVNNLAGRTGAENATSTYLPLILIREILGRFPAPEEEERLSNVDTVLRLSSSLLNKRAERCDASAWPNHDDGLGGVRWKFEVGVPDVDRNMNPIVLVAGTHDLIGSAKRRGIVVTILLLLQGQDVVGRHAAERCVASRDGLILDHSGNRDGLGLHQGRRRDGVVPRLELVQALNEGGERNLRPFLATADLTQEASNVDVVGHGLVMEVVLIVTKMAHLRLTLFGGGKRGESCDKLPGDGSTDFHVVADNGVVSGRGRERNLSSRLESLDVDNLMALIGETEDVEETINLITRVCRPDGDMVTSLVGQVRLADVKVDMDAVAVLDSEEFVRFADRRNVRVLGVERSLAVAL